MTNATSMNEIYQDDDRLQYDDKDTERLRAIAEGITAYSVATIEALGGMSDALLLEPSEDAVYQAKIARQEMVSTWAFLNHVIQKMAWSLRIDAEEAAQRMFQAIKDGKPIDTQGL